MTLMIIFIAGLHLNGINFPLLFSLWVKSIKPIKKVSLPPRFLPLFFLSHLHWCPFHPPTSRDFAELPPRRRCRGFENPLWRSRVRLVLAETGDYRAAPVLLGQSFTQCGPRCSEIFGAGFSLLLASPVPFYQRCCASTSSASDAPVVAHQAAAAFLFGEEFSWYTRSESR